MPAGLFRVYSLKTSRWRKPLPAPTELGLVDQTHQQRSFEADDAPQDVRPRRPRRARRGLLLRAAAWTSAGAIAFALALVALLVLRLSYGPIGMDVLRPAIEDALASRIGANYRVSLGSVSIERGENGPAVTLGRLEIRGPAGEAIVLAPEAEIGLEPIALVFGSVQPTSLELYDVDVRLSVGETGAIAVSAGDQAIVVDTPPVVDTSSSAAPQGTPALSATAAAGRALRHVLDLVTSPSSPVGVLQRVGLARGKLVFADQRSGQRTVFNGLTLGFDRRGDAVRADVSAQGPNGRWRVAARVVGAPGAPRSLDIQADDLSIDELKLATQTRGLPVDFDMPISARVAVSLDATGRATAASGRLALGAGFLTTVDPDQEPIRVDSAAASFSFDPLSRQVAFSGLELNSGETRLFASGTAVPPKIPGDPWNFDIQGGPNSVIGRERPGELPIPINAATLRGRLALAEQKLFVDRFDLRGPDVKVSVGAELGFGPEPHLSVRGEVGRMPGRTVLRLWPSAVAPEVRAWAFEHLQQGFIERGTAVSDLTAQDLANMRVHLGPVDSHSTVEFTASGAAFSFMPGVPPVSGVDLSGRITGRTVNLVANKGVLDAGNGRKLNVLDASLMVPDTDPKPTPTTISVHLAGTLDSLADVLSRDGLKPYANLPIDASTVHGQVDGRLSVDLRLGKMVRPEDTQVRANATVTAFTVDKMIGKERLENATLNVAFDRGALKAQGQGRLFGAPATVELSREAGGTTYATVGMFLDDAARAKQGFAFGTSLTGIVGAKMVSALGQSDKVQADVELDFTKAGIDGLFPGVVKPAGRPGKATFALTMSDGGATLDNLVFEAGPTMARGALAVDATGGLTQARFSQVRLSPGDDMKIDVDQTKTEGMRILLRGASVDARPFLKALFAGSGSGQDATGNRDLDLDVKAPLVTGNNKQVINALDLHLARKNGVVRQFQFTGKMGRDLLSGTMERSREGLPVLQVTSREAGELLAFLDLYKRMEGGKLALSMIFGDNGIAGQMAIRDFVLRDEPALRRLVTEGVPSKDERGMPQIDTTAARFSKLSVDFQRVDGRIDVRNAAMFGQQIGLTLDGTVDFPRDMVNLSGTFVPAFGVNNLFSQIPVLGMFLGGGQHEGLFGVNFRITGPASGPTLSINPLSAIAPGFLRKIFGAVETGGSTTEPPPLLTTPGVDTTAPLQIVPQKR